MPDIYPTTALVLSGGGARGAYQAGVIRGVTQIAAENNLIDRIKIISGVSAGAINASYMASLSDNLVSAGEGLCQLWSRLEAENIFRTDAFTAGRSGLRLIADATIGALYSKKLARSLLDTEPLWTLLMNHINFENIPKMVEKKHLQALGITAMNYSNNVSETFVVGDSRIPEWHRSRRVGFHAPIRVEHIMASSAIPLFFPPIKINDMHFGDGCLRNTAPLSPAIHMGADQLLVVSVRRPDNVVPASEMQKIEPSFARVLGVVLNALMLDAIELDMERMIRVNSTLQHINLTTRQQLKLRPMNWFWVRPSVDIGHMAADNFERLPKVIRYLIGGLGSSREASEITSYLLFDPEFLTSLVDIGYRDVLNLKEQVIAFLTGDKPTQKLQL